jgi:hypothetical protein
MDRNEIPQDPRHLVVPSGASKTVSELVVRSAQTMHLSCVKICTSPNKLNQVPTWASSPRSTIRCVQNDFWACGTFGTNHEPILCQDEHYLQMNWIKDPLVLHHLGVQSGASKMISEPTVCLAQTVHLSCIESNTISTWTKTRFQMTHVTLEFHRVRPKWFLRLWYVRHKPCTNLASRLEWIESSFHMSLVS